MGLFRHAWLAAILQWTPFAQWLFASALLLTGASDSAIVLQDFEATSVTSTSSTSSIDNFFICDNVTNAGQINYPQTLCGIPADPAPLVNTAPATGGTGAIQYQWMASTAQYPNDLGYAIPGATGLTYDPGPNDFIASNSEINIEDVGIQQSGLYYVTVGDETGCVNTKEQLVTVGSSVVLEAGNNGPLCAGQTLELYATDGADSYFWTGPNGFTSTEQNPVILNASLAYDGIFTVTATGGTCAGTAITGVEIKIELNPVATSNSPVCVGETIQLFASGGANISWYGPNNYFTTDDNPTINNASAADAGLYTAIVGTGICKDSVSLFVEVNPGISPNLNITPADCNSPGAIDLVVIGGIPPYSFDWSDLPGSADPEDRTNLAAGTYNVTIYDASSCGLPINNLFVADLCSCDEPNVLNIVVVESNCGESTGSILIELDQSPVNYNYAWSPNQGTPTGSGNGRVDLPSGLYIVTITDPLQNNCGTIVTIPVGISDGPVIENIISDPSNCSMADGAITILPADYQYTWAIDGFVGNSRSDLPSGGFDVLVLDPLNPNCPDIITVQVGQINNLNAEAIVNIVPTCGEANGTVSINMLSGGGGNLSFQWSNGGNAVTENNLSAGTYGVLITDVNSGCTFNLIFALADEVAPATVTVEPFYEVSCVGSLDAMADFSIEYDDNFVNPANITITDVGGAVYQNGQLGPGQYCVIVEDGNGCLAGTGCFNVIQPAALDVDVTITASECQSPGAINVLVSGGNPLYIFDWEDLPGSNDPQNRPGLFPGEYSLTVTDNNACTAVALNLIVADNCNGGDCTSPPVVNDIIVVDSNCDQEDGQAIINLTTNFSDYTYEWSTDLGQPNAIGNARTNLPAGTYTVTITDINDPTCFLMETFSVGNADGPQVNVETITPSACSVNNGSAILTAVPGLIYNWSDSGFGPERFDLGAIEYQVTVTDVATGCFTIVVIDVPVIDELQINIIVNQEPDCNASNGSVTAEVLGGSGSYFYSWGPDATLSDLASGTYVVTITDLTTGCISEQIFTLNDNIPGASVIVNAEIALSCPGAQDGFADPLIIYEAGFDNPPNISIIDGNGNTYVDGQLPEGSYCIIVEDANGCLAASACFEVVSPGAIDIAIQIEAVTCATPGSIDLTVTGPNGPYLFNWADLPGNINPPDRFGLAAGLYSVTITDNNSCAIAIDDLLVEDDCTITPDCEEPQIVNINNTASTCGENNGAIAITLTEDVSNYVFTWMPVVSTSNTASDLPTGVYTITIAKANDVNCFTEISIPVGNADGPTAEIVATSPASCEETNGTATLSPTGLIYEWCDGATGFNNINLPAGICFVTVTDPATNCTNILEVMIDAINLLEAEAIIQTEPACGDNDGEVSIQVSGGSTNYQYNWSDGGTTQSRNNLEAGIYTVTVTDLGANGCETVVVFVLENKTAAGATINLESNMVQLSCPGGMDGIVVIDGIDYETGFAFPSTITIVDVNNQTVNNGALSAGDYCILIYDANDCLAGSACFLVDEPEVLELNIALINKDCNTLGTIELDLLGGTAPYLFDWADLPGANNTMDRIDLEPGVYSVTITDANGCIVAADNITITDECLSCPSPDSVALVLPVFNVDSFCVELESCFDLSTTTYELLSGGFAGSSANGFWSLNPVGCLFYHSTGTIGPNLDTIYVLANDNGLTDTTCIFVTITQPCFGLTGLDSVTVSTFDCDLGTSFCLNVPITNIGLYSFIDNGVPYAGGFQGCDFQMISTYNLSELLVQFPDGPYQLDSWTVNTDVFTLASFDNLQQLVAQMNIWDPAGGWFLNMNGDIQGGFSGNSYGFLDITHIPTGISFTNTFALGTVNVPVGTLLEVDTGYHQIVMMELSTGCLDTIHVDVLCNSCPPVYSGPTLIQTALCDELTMICTDIEIDDIENYLVTDNGAIYTAGFMGCNFDSLFAYLAIDFSNGAYTLDSWTVNGTGFTMVDFSNLQELVDSMNVWDPLGNWTTNGVIIVGGDFSNSYGELVVSQNGSPVGIYDTAPQLNPNGISMELEVGVHELIFTDTFSNCVDTVQIEILCVDCPDYVGPGILFTFNCDEDAQLCLDIPIVNIANYTFTDNGQTYVGSLLGCDFDTTYLYSGLDFNLFSTYTVQSWLVNGIPNFLGFFSSLDELVFWMNNVDPGGNWEINGFLISGGQSGNTYGNLEVSEFGNPLPPSVAQIQLIPNGVGIDLGLGSHEVIVADTIIGCLDTINLVVQCLTDGLPDTIYLDILNGFSDTFCIDISYLPGTLDTIYNFCEDSNVDINTEVFLLDSLACFEYTGLEVGQDTACFAFCDNLGNCDTLYVIIDVYSPMVDTIFTTVILTDTDTLCLDVSEIPGSMYTVTNLCPGESGDFVLFSSQPDSVCILYTGVALGVDTACFEVCDELGYCHTTILIVETVLDNGIGPVAVNDTINGQINTGIIIDVINNDTLNGTLADITILTDPVNGIAVVNPDLTVSYIPDVDFCGSVDSFEYVLMTSSGADTAFVYVDVYCDELSVYTGFSPNEDGVNDGFIIKGINNFPNNEVRVYNRWGNEVFLKKGYRNNDPWKGLWQGKDLPDGTYFYIIDDGEGRQYSGYVQIHR